MATFDQLSAAVDSILSSSTGSNTLSQFNSATRGHVFEAYVFSLVLQAVVDAGGSVVIKGILSGDNPSPIMFRGGPGQMSSRTQDFSFAECSINGHEFEVHVGVQYVGTSGALHEIDVSIFDHDRAEQIREDRVIPNTRNLRAAIECKFYDSSLGVNLGRTFVGLVSDMGGLKIKSFATNGRNKGLAEYFSKSGRPSPFFALTPLNPDVVNRFVKSLEQDLRTWCSVY